jgi:hypothetical protein
MNSMFGRIKKLALIAIFSVLIDACIPTVTPVATPILGATPRIVEAIINTPTVAPPYIHYIPSKGFNIHLEFDYPSSWTFSEDKYPQVESVMIIALGDPRFRTLPTPIPNPDYLTRTISDYGSVSILISPSEPGQTSDTELESRKQAYSNERMITLLSDYKITIDDYDAGVLEYQMNDPENYTSLMFIRRIFFFVRDQKYEIYFEVAEKDRGGEFENGYDYFFNSLKIVP